jgi:hypothetical protein
MKKQTTTKDINTHIVKGKRSKVAAASEKTADDGWERLLKIREKLRKDAASKDEVMDRLAKLGRK